VSWPAEVIREPNTQAPESPNLINLHTTHHQLQAQLDTFPTDQHGVCLPRIKPEMHRINPSTNQIHIRLEASDIQSRKDRFVKEPYHQHTSTEHSCSIHSRLPLDPHTYRRARAQWWSTETLHRWPQPGVKCSHPGPHAAAYPTNNRWTNCAAHHQHPPASKTPSRYDQRWLAMNNPLQKLRPQWQQRHWSVVLYSESFTVFGIGVTLDSF